MQGPPRMDELEAKVEIVTAVSAKVGGLYEPEVTKVEPAF